MIHQKGRGSIVKSLFLSFFLLGIGSLIHAQELKCNVQVISPKVEGINKKVFETMQQSLNEFMNGQKWTEHVFAEHERIECSFLINITRAISVDEFEGTVQVQARRPVYGSSYYTVLFNYLDEKFQCKYTEYQPMVYNPNTFDSNLIAIMAFYAHMILGFDYDSFSNMGGTPYFVKAQQIVSRAQSAQEPGWKAFESKRNRYWMVTDWLDEQVKPLRQSYYAYHRLSLDNMSTKMAQARTEMMEAFEGVRKVTRTKPATFAIQLFFDAKSQEIMNIFTEANQVEKTKVLEILKEVDPDNGTKYDAALKSSN